MKWRVRHPRLPEAVIRAESADEAAAVFRALHGLEGGAVSSRPALFRSAAVEAPMAELEQLGEEDQ